jgi:hypothetical protein
MDEQGPAETVVVFGVRVGRKVDIVCVHPEINFGQGLLG